MRGSYQSVTSAIFTKRSSARGRAAFSNRHRAAQALERCEHPLDLLWRMLRGHGDAYSAGMRGHGRRNDRMCEDSVVEERAPCGQRAKRVADQDGNHWRARLADVESERTKTGRNAARVLPQSCATLGLCLKD